MSQKQYAEFYKFCFDLELLIKQQKHLVFTIGDVCSICQVLMCHPEAYSEPCQTSKTEYIAKIDYNF